MELTSKRELLFYILPIQTTKMDNTNPIMPPSKVLENEK